MQLMNQKVSVKCEEQHNISSLKLHPSVLQTLTNEIHPHSIVVILNNVVLAKNKK